MVNFKDNILYVSNDFERSFSFLHEWEVINPKAQISGDILDQTIYNNFRKSFKLKEKLLGDITTEEVKMILYENIWKKFNCEIFSYPLNLILFNTFFDFNVNTTIKIINKCLGVKSEDFQSKLLLENDISECICKNRIHRRNIVIPIYQNKIEYNVLALSKDKELLQLCNDKDF